MEGLLKHLHKSFVLSGNLNSQNTIRESKQTNKKWKITEKLIMDNELCLLNQGAAILIGPLNGRRSAIDLNVCVIQQFTRTLPVVIYEDTCGRRLFPHYPEQQENDR